MHQSGRNDAVNTSTFVVPLTDALKSGFHFKLVGAGGQPPLSGFEAETANRFWCFWYPSDGPNIWVKSCPVDAQSQPITH